MSCQPLVGHFSKENHKEYLKRIATFFKPKYFDSEYKSNESPSPTLGKVQKTIDVSIANSQILKAEYI